MTVIKMNQGTTYLEKMNKEQLNQKRFESNRIISRFETFFKPSHNITKLGLKLVNIR